MTLKFKDWVISDFSGGLNTRFNPRNIAPSKSGDKAESPYMENMDIVEGGAILTSSGYELISSRGSGTGGVKNLQYYDKDGTTKQLIITHDDDHLTITASDSTWTAIASSDYGTASDNVGSVVYKGDSATRRVILGNDTSGNTTRKYDGTAYADLLDTPPDGPILVEFMGFLFSMGDPSAKQTITYSNVEDEDDWAGGGSIGYNEILTGGYVEGEKLWVFTKDYSQPITFSYDNSFNLSVPLKDPFKRDGGCYHHKTIAGSFNKTYFFGPNGVLTIGSDTEYANNNSLVDSLSWKIKPSFDNVNYSQTKKFTAEYFNRQYLLALPQRSEEFNSQVFVYNLDYNAWTYRTGLYVGDFEVFPDENNVDELVFGSALAPDLFKFNDSYSYNGAGYKRRWISKIFNFGSTLNKKLVDYVDLTGSMAEITEFKVIVTVDGVAKTFIVDKDSLITSSGGYIGDEYMGDQYLGGEAEPLFKRFYHRIMLPAEIREGHEFQVEFQNEAVGQPFKVDYFNWHYAYLPSSNLADKYYNSNISAL